MILSALKILGSLLLLAGVLAGVRQAGRRLGWQAESSRKLIHCSLGLYTLLFPLVFDHAWEVLATCILAMALMVLVRTVPGLRRYLGQGLHGVQRDTMGEIYFACSVALVFYLSRGQAVLYVLPLAILTLCDAAAALVGVGYAKTAFVVEKGRKSWEGTFAFFITAWLLAMICLLLLSAVGRVEVVCIALLVAIFGSLIEAASWRGLDNLFVPVGLFFLLDTVQHTSVWALVGVNLAFGAALLGANQAAGWLRLKRHSVFSALTALFYIGVVGSWSNIAAPLALFGLHLWTNRDQPPDDDLMVLLSIVATALFWYLIGVAFNLSTVYAFHLAFGLHMVMTAALHPRWNTLPRMGLVTAAAWMLVNLRLLSIAAPDGRLLSLAALALLGAGGLAVRWQAGCFQDQRWPKQAIAAVGLSSVGIPLMVWP
jgi:phytol kinase